MSVLRRSDIIRRYNKNQSINLGESAEKRYARRMVNESLESLASDELFDIFLSHSYEDARVVKQIKDMLSDKGYSVYVDWIEDDHLDRGEVTEETAEVLKSRMDRCGSLIYLASQSAESSVWMPWELGYMDAKTGRVAVAPVLNDDENFEGREYLGLYPYLDLTVDDFYVHRSESDFAGLDRWMHGAKI